MAGGVIVEAKEASGSKRGDASARASDRNGCKEVISVFRAAGAFTLSLEDSDLAGAKAYWIGASLVSGGIVKKGSSRAEGTSTTISEEEVIDWLGTINCLTL